MGKLAERRHERAEITRWYDEEKVSIHAEYMQALSDLETATRAKRAALARVQREAWNKALAVADAGEV